MPDEEIMPVRSLIGFRGRQFEVFPDELTFFLLHCDDLGFHNSGEIIAELEKIKSVLSQTDFNDAVSQNKHIQFLNELCLLLRGTIYETESSGGG